MKSRPLLPLLNLGVAFIGPRSVQTTGQRPVRIARWSYLLTLYQGPMALATGPGGVAWLILPNNTPFFRP